MAQKQQSDSEADGLRGKVKTVVAEYAEVADESGKLVEGRRQPHRTDFYDEHGNLTRALVYNEAAELSDTFDYFYLNGERVYRTEDVSPDEDIPTAAVTPPEGKQGVADQRYDVKLKYKYDESGKRIEATTYLSDGSLEDRTVNEFDSKGNLVKKSDYIGQGELGSITSYTYDDNGNVTGETVQIKRGEMKGVIMHDYTYRYDEFDARGNWVKRYVSDAVHLRRPSPPRLVLVDYRAITYY